MLLSLYSYFRFCFRHIRHIRALFKSILTHIQNPGIFLSQSTFRIQGIFIIIGPRAKIFWEGTARKVLFHENMLMIWSTINILPLVLTYFIICLRNKKELLPSSWKQSHFCVERLVLTAMQLIKEYKSIVNGLIKTISGKTLYKLNPDFLTITILHLNKIWKPTQCCL